MPLNFLKIFLLFFLLAVLQAEATNFQPWLGNIYEFELRPSVMYQNYSHLSSGSHSNKYSSNDFFLNGSVANALETWGVELEATGAWTRKQNGDLDQLKLTGRYIWSDDIAGDALSVATGLSYTQAFTDSLKDVSSFHHGRCEGELFVSIGKEYSLDACWNSRWWSILGIGSSVARGSPWIRFNIAYEKCWQDKHEMRAFVHSLWGLGEKRLHLSHFEGYGSVQHQSIDLGLRYTCLIDFFGSASLQYSYRVHARNFPESAHQILAEVLYTFGL